MESKDILWGLELVHLVVSDEYRVSLIMGDGYSIQNIAGSAKFREIRSSQRSKEDLPVPRSPAVMPSDNHGVYIRRDDGRSSARVRLATKKPYLRMTVVIFYHLARRCEVPESLMCKQDVKFSGRWPFGCKTIGRN